MQPPGIYIEELGSPENQFIPVPTAIPAFVGYTPQTSLNDKSLLNVARKVSSFQEFLSTYGFPIPDPPAVPPKQFSPEYYLVEQKSKPEKGLYISVGSTYYSILPDPSTVYYLYNSIRWFYENGGGEAYIVSVGAYGPAAKTPGAPGDLLVNPNVKLADLQKGLEALKKEPEPTLYICPEAILLSAADNGTLMQSMMAQCSDLGTAISIFDVIGGKAPDPVDWMTDIEAFRDNTGQNGRDFGAAYYPFVQTSVILSSEIDYTNLFGGDVKQLKAILNPPSDPNPAAATAINNILNPPEPPLTREQNQNALLNASPTFVEIMKIVLADANTLPTSGAMAGIITVNDQMHGVWNSPANVSISGAIDLPIYLTDQQGAELNVPFSGRAINPIRSFTNQGILVWGARSLLGNSNDFRHISARRTVNFLEQSMKLALERYVFSPNTSDTWNSVKSEFGKFLTGIWNQGGLYGSTSAEAFNVLCGLGETMTGEDILNGILRVNVMVAVVRPADFIAITLEQNLPHSG